MATVDYSLERPHRITLLNGLSKLLPTLQQDPVPATTLVQMLIAVPEITFTDILDLEPKINFVAGLISDSISFKVVTLELLKKAKYNEGDGGE